MKRNALALLIALTLVFAVSAVTPSPAKADAPIGWEINHNSNYQKIAARASIDGAAGGVSVAALWYFFVR